MIKHNCSIFCIFFFLFFILIPGEAEEFNPDGFGAWSDYLDSIYGEDDNAGLTAFPILNIPMGGRSEGMAGAFAAVADDISFLEFNPAGSSMLKRSELAFFHNNWIADTKIEGGAFASRYRNFGFGAGAKWLYTPFTEYNMFGDRVSKGYYSEAVAVLNASWNFLSGYYFSGVSVGINLKGAFRFVPDFADDNDNIISGSGRSQSAAMVMGDIGALTRFDFLKPYNSRDRNTSLALVMKNLGPPSGTSLDDPYKDPLPTTMVAALAYKPLRPLLLSFDFSLPLNMMDPSLSEKPYWAMGFAADVTSFLSMRAGFQSRTGNVRLVVGSAVSLKKISLDVNYTLDLMTQLQPLNRVSLGVRLDLGDQGRGDLSARTDAFYLAGLDAYAAGNYAEAEHNWEEALKLDPKFAPAKEGLAILRHTRSVEQRINDLQRLEY